jgi:hypothetical protein
MSKLSLKNGINAFLDNLSGPEISRNLIKVYGDDNWPEINAALAEWEQRGFLKILVPPETAGEDVKCVRMLKYIEIESPWGDKWPPKSS